MKKHRWVRAGFVDKLRMRSLRLIAKPAPTIQKHRWVRAGFVDKLRMRSLRLIAKPAPTIQNPCIQPDITLFCSEIGG